MKAHASSSRRFLRCDYGFGLVLTTYFLHLDGEGDAARAKMFLKALREGKKGEQAIEVLLDGRDY